jgi:hypothetical protein
MIKDKYLNRVLLKTRPIESLSMEAGLFAQSLGLAGLAVDLARLEWQRDKSSKRSPREFLDVAAELVNAASLHTGTNANEVLQAIGEKQIREREKGRKKWDDLFDAASDPFPVILKGGVEFPWKPIGTKRGRRAFLKKHWDRLGVEVSERLSCEQRLMDGGVTPGVMQQFAVTRMRGNKDKGNGKRRKSGEVEGTTNGEPKKVKKQAGARKKQA